VAQSPIFFFSFSFPRPDPPGAVQRADLLRLPRTLPFPHLFIGREVTYVGSLSECGTFVELGIFAAV
jgi:hypothetical protein